MNSEEWANKTREHLLSELRALADTAEQKAAADPKKEAVALDLARWLRRMADSGETSWGELYKPNGLPRRYDLRNDGSRAA